MSELPLYVDSWTPVSKGRTKGKARFVLQGYLAHKKQRPSRTLQ